MKKLSRIPKIMKRLQDVWVRNHNMRLAQLLINVLPFDFYYIEDGELIKRIERYYEFSRGLNGESTISKKKSRSRSHDFRNYSLEG